MSSAAPAIYGLIGDPVDHSLSPVMHNAAFAALRLDARYDLFPTPLDELAARTELIRAGVVRGANVTVPHKEAVVALCDDVTETARQIGAVNTLTMRDGGLYGDSTDGFGFLRSLDGAGTWPSSAPALIIGAGGAARAIVVALRQSGVGRVVVANRTPSRAERLVAELTAAGVRGVHAVGLDESMAAARTCGLLVNATSIGWHGDELPVSNDVIAALPETTIVADLTYRSTALLRAAADRGLRTLDGLGMLLYQGVRSFEIWTGVHPPVDVMRAAIVDEQARRAGPAGV